MLNLPGVKPFLQMPVQRIAAQGNRSKLSLKLLNEKLLNMPARHEINTGKTERQRDREIERQRDRDRQGQGERVLSESRQG